MNRSSTLRRGAVGATAGLALLGIVGTSAPAHAATVPEVLAKIRYCESGGNYRAQNPTSSAAGAYQFLTSTWQSLSAAQGYATASQAPASVQDAAAIELYNQLGTSPWAASQSCWSALGAVPTTGSTTTGSSSTGSATTGSSTSTGGTSAASTASTASTSTTSAASTGTGSGTKRTTSKATSASRDGAKARTRAKASKPVNQARQHTNRTDRDGDGTPDCKRTQRADTAKVAANKSANPAPAKSRG